MRNSLCLYYKDGHSVEEIVYEWFPGQTEVLVGNSEMAQFEYKGSNLSSKFELFSEGQLERNLIWESLNMLQDLADFLTFAKLKPWF